MDFPGPRDPLAEARKSYVQFYLLASLEDEQLLDLLVITRAALLPIMNTPRDYVPPVIRDGVEKTTDATERVFTELREAVRACATFQRISDDERCAIEKVAFQVKAPERD